MATDGRMDFGIFMAPFHRVGENPSLAIHRDLELIEWLDQLGYDEAWIGEHHSAGWELIASPEVFIAAAAERTSNIRLGTGVISLPYHHPLMVVDRMIQLDHMTRGRVMMGVGPGALSSDARMMGIDPLYQRQRMDESLQGILALLRQDGPVNMKTDWFELTDARLQVSPYTKPHFEMAVASTVSPAGRQMAGKYGMGMLSIGVYLPGGRSNLEGQWTEVEEVAEREGQTVDRNKWRLVIPMYIAETREQAFNEAREGWRAWQIDYFRDTLQAVLPGTAETPEGAVETGGAIIGTPDDAIQAIEILQENSGGFGGSDDARPRMGQPRRHPPLIRTVRPLRRAEVPGPARFGRGNPAMGRLRRRSSLLQPQRRAGQGLHRRRAGRPGLPPGASRGGIGLSAVGRAVECPAEPFGGLLQRRCRRPGIREPN